MRGKRNRPRGYSSGRCSSMVKGYVKGGSFVKPFSSLESMCSAQSGKGPRQGGFLWWLLAKVESTKWIPRRPKGIHPWPRPLSRNPLMLSRKFKPIGWGGFQVASPVKTPRASQVARSAPPYTDCAREEPCRGERRTRPIAAFQQPPRMLRCGPSKRPLVHGAAFLSTETSVCGQSASSLRVHNIQFRWCSICHEGREGDLRCGCKLNWTTWRKQTFREAIPLPRCH